MLNHLKNYYLFYIVFIGLIVLPVGIFVYQRISHEPPVATSQTEQTEDESSILAQESVASEISQDPEPSEPQDSTPTPETDLAEVDPEDNSSKASAEDNVLSTPDPAPKQPTDNKQPAVSPAATPKISTDGYYVVLKDVGEPYLYNFGLGPNDYREMKKAGVDIIEGNFDICATPSEVLIFLEGAKDAGLKVIMPAGAGEAEWGYPCDENFSATQKPQWQKEKVQAWVKKWAYHPAIYAWDISNEDGQNFPNGQSEDGENAWVEQGYALSTAQLQQAYKDVKAADPTRPIMIRMNGWYFYDYNSNFFRPGNAFGPNVADIVMVNAYSNVEEYFSDFVTVVSSRTHDAVRAINPKAKIIVALGAWEEPPIWFRPSAQQFQKDVEQAKKTKDLLGVAVFKYGAEEGEWWMPKNAAELWGVIRSGVLK